MEAQTVFLNTFTICSLCKQKFVVCLFVDKETNGSYPFANGLNRLAHLCRLAFFLCHNTIMLTQYISLRREAYLPEQSCHVPFSHSQIPPLNWVHVIPLGMVW